MPKTEVKILSVDPSNLEEVGFFCYKSKRDTPGYAHKLSWVRERLAEEMRLQILLENGVSKGFIEYIPGEYAWHAVKASGYMIIHCMWVVGKAKGKGYGTRLLEQCIREARQGGFHGVAMLTSRATWLANAELFLKSGFEVVDTTPPSFSLLAMIFGRHAPPSLPTDGDARQRAYGSDLTVVYTHQCPYIDRMKQTVSNVARQLGIPAQEVQLTDANQVQRRAPSP
ncbi:MAG: hypothetical protein A2W33_06160 [Chloroflexi bacterium RBG_16_52_11]|nr:MAG: hypothetical protein A2W33_06160 [Chloroflexi bacterium RBG_16_52_11]